MTMGRLFLDGAVYAFVASVCLMAGQWYNPRLLLQDYPEAIQERVPPKTERETRLSLVVGIPFLLILLLGPLFSTLALSRRLGGEAAFLTLFVNATAVAWMFNLVDWLVLDWLIFCTWTPRFVVVPGTEDDLSPYRNYGYHFRGFLIGTAISMAAGLVIAGFVSLLQ